LPQTDEACFGCGSKIREQLIAGLYLDKFRIDL
jgi:hypothetical protein